MMPAGVVSAALFAVLGTSAVTDVWTGKIYNAITYPAIAIGLIGGLTGATSGLGSSITGCLVGGGLLYAMFALRWMGGGDVKLMAAVGALQGYPFVLHALFYSIFLGGLFAALTLIWRAEAAGLATDVAAIHRVVTGAAGNRRIVPRGGSIPFAVPIALGTLIALTWHAG